MTTYYEKYGKAFAEEQERKRLERKRKFEAENPVQHRITATWVIRTTLAEKPEATVEEVLEACKAAGVSASLSTIKRVRRAFKRDYLALLETDQIMID